MRKWTVGGWPTGKVVDGVCDFVDDGRWRRREASRAKDPVRVLSMELG